MRAQGLSTDGARPGPLAGGGATLRLSDGAGWVLAQAEPHRALGMALAWMARNEVRACTLVVDVDPGGRAQRAPAAVLTRRVEGLRPPLAVHVLDGTVLQAVEPASVPDLTGVATDLAVAAFVAEAQRVGVEVVPAGRNLSLEVLGLEVARVVAVDEGLPRLEVGVGKHDRSALDELYHDQPGAVALEQAVGAVRAERRSGAMPGPANLLSRERWLRHALCAQPGAVGATALMPMADESLPVDLRRPRPAGAVGRTDDGSSVVVVASAGVDLDLVPAAADLWLAAGRPDDIVLALPEGDDQPITRDLAGCLLAPVAVRTVAPPWDPGPSPLPSVA